MSTAHSSLFKPSRLARSCADRETLLATIFLVALLIGQASAATGHAPLVGPAVNGVRHPSSRANSARAKTDCGARSRTRSHWPNAEIQGHSSKPPGAGDRRSGSTSGRGPIRSQRRAARPPCLMRSGRSRRHQRRARQRLRLPRTGRLLPATHRGGAGAGRNARHDPAARALSRGAHHAGALYGGPRPGRGARIARRQRDVPSGAVSIDATGQSVETARQAIARARAAGHAVCSSLTPANVRSTRMNRLRARPFNGARG